MNEYFRTENTGLLEKLPSLLSCEQRKLALYSKDIYFREAWWDLCEKWGEPFRIEQKFWRLAPIIFKPEAVLSGQIRMGLDLIAGLPLKPIFARAVRYDRHKIRAAWQYQINKATPERLSAMDAILQASEAVYVLLIAEEEFAMDVPAIVEICDLKGPAAPKDRRDFHLRSKFDLQDNLVNFFHSVDEPADVIREIGVLFDSKERRAMLDRVESEESCFDELVVLVNQVLARNPKSDLDLSNAVARVMEQVDIHFQRRKASQPAEDRGIRSDLERIANGARGVWPQLSTKLKNEGVSYDPLDGVTIACLSTVMHIEGERAILSSNNIEAWQEADKRQEIRRLNLEFY
tara:strand:- start:2319 stop:3359 length:1041 start_codon:yes stop_codon:yes gene_type:complete